MPYDRIKCGDGSIKYKWVGEGEPPKAEKKAAAKKEKEKVVIEEQKKTKLRSKAPEGTKATSIFTRATRKRRR